MGSAEFANATAGGLATSIAGRELSVCEVVDAHLRRIEDVNAALWSHLNLAMRAGRARTENHFTDDETRRIKPPVLFIWGDRDVYGGPQIGRRAVELMPAARLEVIPGGHAPFLDDPERCGALITAFLGETAA